MSKGYIFFLDFGVKGLCYIGGNLVINVGGLCFFCYGSLYGIILGIEVVLVDGIIVDDFCKFCKNNIGYDLK